MFMRSSICLVSVCTSSRKWYRTLWDFDTWTNLIWWLTFTDDNSISGRGNECCCSCDSAGPKYSCQIGGQLFCVHFIMVCFDGCERLFSILNLIWFSAFHNSHLKWSKIIELFESVWNENWDAHTQIERDRERKEEREIDRYREKERERGRKSERHAHKLHDHGFHTNAQVGLNYAFICMRPYHHVPQSLLSICRSVSVCQVSN